MWTRRPQSLFCILSTAEEVHTLLNKLVASAGPCMRRSALSSGDILAGMDLRLLYEFVKKSFIEGSFRNVDKVQTKMKTVEEENEVVELVENNHTLVAVLPSSQNSDHTILCVKKKAESKCSEETQRNTLDFLRFWLDCFWAEKYRGPQRVYPCIIYLRMHWTDVLAL